MRTGHRLLLVTVLLLPLVACRPLYVPLVPEPTEFDPRVEVAVQSNVVEGRPVVDVFLRQVPEEGWLAVQWYSPANREVASQSSWIEPAMLGSKLEFSLPEDVEPSTGRWRALVSIDGSLLRQASIAVD